ncbi:PIN domain-containing protein [Methylomonas koyamae]|uniref:PIN domain-containing protein n=1 Tax=Methylomonas koyamae TaxID=702114 RepID=UPI0028733BEB|nr:PIN domain-containing protein [Methylomonas koyamae]WNB76409.1 PIN domain-containing protein [Methylomonas koyamae]
MNVQTPESQPLSTADIFTVRSDKLKDLRVVIQAWKGFNDIFGELVQFRLIVDTNVILGDLIWLVSKRKNKDAKTELMETIEAETIDVYAPPLLFIEVEEKIPDIASKKDLDVDQMLNEWQIYKSRIKISEPDSAIVNGLKSSVDPNDADFIALAQTISADGVLSKDKDIAQMGGNQITILFVTHLRNYSRATAIELNIKVNGMIFAYLSVTAFQGLFTGIQSLSSAARAAPTWVKFGLLASTVFVAAHPNSRANALRLLKTVLAGIADATPAVIGFIAEAAVLADSHKSEAQAHLNKALMELNKHPTSESQNTLNNLRSQAC